MSLITEHQNAGQPQIISFSVDKTKLSGKTYVDPQGKQQDFSKATLSFQSNKSFLKCLIRITKDGNDYDMYTGTLVYELNGTKVNPRPAATTFTTEIQHNSIVEGDGLYRISIYVLDIDEVWNYEYLLIDVNNNEILDKNNNQVYVQAEGE